MFTFHRDPSLSFQHQLQNTQHSVLPFIEHTFPLRDGMRVMEVGVGHGGVLKAFINRGCIAVALDCNPNILEDAQRLLSDDIQQKKVQCICKDIHDLHPNELEGTFDLIILKDAIEHIHDKEKLLLHLKTLLSPEGVIFIGFPPWFMPFGGHQQICNNKIASLLPYYHLLPMPIYKAMLCMFGESKNLDELLEIKQLGLIIEKFKRLLRKTSYRVLGSEHFLVNPIYQYKFGFRPRKQFAFIKYIPYIRNFFTTGVYYLIQPK